MDEGRVDIETIMEQIRAAALSQDRAGLPAFEEIPIQRDELEFDERAFIEASGYIAGQSEVPYYFQMGSSGGLSSFLKRAVRRAAKGVLLPIRERQNALNARYAGCIGGIAEQVEAISALEAENARRLDALEAGRDGRKDA